jgi:hypothetical protein
MALDHPPGESEKTGHIARARPSMPETSKRAEELPGGLSSHGGGGSRSEHRQHPLDARADGFHVAVSKRRSEEPDHFAIERIAVAVRKLEGIGREIAGIIAAAESLETKVELPLGSS